MAMLLRQTPGQTSSQCVEWRRMRDTGSIGVCRYIGPPTALETKSGGKVIPVAGRGQDIPIRCPVCEYVGSLFLPLPPLPIQEDGLHFCPTGIPPFGRERQLIRERVFRDGQLFGELTKSWRPNSDTWTVLLPWTGRFRSGLPLCLSAKGNGNVPNYLLPIFSNGNLEMWRPSPMGASRRHLECTPCTQAQCDLGSMVYAGMCL